MADSNLPERLQAKYYTCGRYLAEYSKNLLLGLVLFNICINGPVNGLHSPLIKLADATHLRELVKSKRGLKRGRRRTEKNRRGKKKRERVQNNMCGLNSGKVTGELFKIHILPLWFCLKPSKCN